MNTVINTRFIGPDAQDRFEAFLKTHPNLSGYIEYDKTTGVVLVVSTAKHLVGTILKSIGGKYPTAFTVFDGSEDEKIVRRVYADLPENDKPHVQIIPAYVGCRVSVCIDQYRDDIQAKFWAALYPPGTDADRTRGGRTREYPEIDIKLPEELKSAALIHGDWSQMIARDDGLYVTDQLVRVLQEEFRKSMSKRRNTNPGHWSSRDPRSR